MALKKFRMVARDGALWRGEPVPAGFCALVLGGQTEEDVRWFFARIDWWSWRIEVIDDTQVPPKPPTSARRGAPQLSEA
jgi:hypothetical protein